MYQPPPQNNQQGVPPSSSPQPAPTSSDVQVKVVLITTLGAVLVAIITYILAPVIVARLSSSPTHTPSASSTPSPFPSQNPYPPYIGALALNNPLHSSTPNWEVSPSNSTDPGTCRFISLAYYASQPQTKYFTTCGYQGDNYMNFAFEVGMTIIQGDCGGIFFDADDVGKHFYYFSICQKDGAYVLYSVRNNMRDQKVASAPSCSAFKTGLGHFNTIAVDVQGHNFDLYVNKQKLANTWDSSYNLSYDQGFIGVLAENLGLQTIVAFNDAKVWKW